MVGSHLVKWFSREGHRITRIVRHPAFPVASPGVVPWDIERGTMDRENLEGQDVVVHLAGANISGRRWSPEYKQLIGESRVQGTQVLCRNLIRLKHPPQILFSASAIGYYGNRSPSERLDESCSKGEGFLSDVCEQWEKASQEAQNFGIRVVSMRFGIILSRSGGALAKMIPIFRLGLGGRLGSGQQIMSWVALEETPHIILHLLDCEIAGPVNVVSPQSVSNREFTALLSRVLKRPAVFPVPEFLISFLLGEMGRELLLSGAKVVPGVLERSGYRFRYPDLESLIESYLKDTSSMLT